MPARDHGPSVKDDEQYEALREDGMSKAKAARIANASANEGRDEVVGHALSDEHLRELPSLQADSAGGQVVGDPDDMGQGPAEALRVLERLAQRQPCRVRAAQPLIGVNLLAAGALERVELQGRVLVDGRDEI